MDILSTSVGVLIGLVTTSLFRVIESGVKKRVYERRYRRGRKDIQRDRSRDTGETRRNTRARK